MYRNCTPLLPVLDTEWLCPRKNLGTINLRFDYVPENQGHSRLPKPSPKKISTLTKTHSARNLGFIFDEHLTFSDQISTLSKSYTITFVNYAVSASTIATSIGSLYLSLRLWSETKKPV